MINITNVTKTYPNGVQANKNISLTVAQGEVVGLVGPNGSGKTTLIQQILGVIKIGCGTITIDDRENDPSRLAYVPQFPAIYPALTVNETVLAALYYCGYNKREALGKAEITLTRAGLTSIANHYAYALSGGQKKLLSFACALAQEKQYLILDEATAMIDILSKETIWKLIGEEKDKGTAVLIASHDIPKIKRLCSSFVVMKNGEIVFRGKPMDLKSDFCRCKITVASIESTMKALLEAGGNFLQNGSEFEIITDDIAQMLLLMQDVAGASEILALECEHPAFYEGILSIIKERAIND